MSTLINHPLSIIYHGVIKPGVRDLLNRECTQKDLSQRWRVSPKAVCELVSSEGIERGYRTKNHEIEHAEGIKQAVHQYVNEFKPMGPSARDNGIGVGFFRKYLVRNGIEIRKATDTNLQRSTIEIESRIVELFKTGETKANIRRSLGISNGFVSSVLRKSGLSTPQKRSKHFPADYLPPSTSEQSLDRVNSWLIQNVRSSCNMRGDLVKGITSKDLQRIFDGQNGRCYYTGIKMCTVKDRVVRNPFLISADRLDSSGDYTPGNVVLCCMFINYAKNNWDADTFWRMLDAVKSNEPESKNATK